MLLLIGCGQEAEEPDVLSKGKTLAIGKFQLSGSAQTGQYARQLYKVDRLLAQELARVKQWQIVETDRINELLSESDSGSKKPGQLDQLLNRLVNEAISEIGQGEPVALQSDDPIDELPKADYLLVGEMDGFDVYYDDSAQSIKGVTRTLQTRTRRARSHISFRVVDVKNRKWLISHSRNIEIILPDDRNAESQVDLALSTMVKEAIATIGQEETLQLASATAPQSSTTAGAAAASGTGMRPVKVAFGGFSILHPDYDAERGAFTPKGATTAISAAKVGRLSFGELMTMKSITPELEAMISHRLNTAAGLKIMEQDARRIKSLLAQQVLTDLSKGRQPGLPMGTIQGADYLVFGTIYDLRMMVTTPRFVEGVAMNRGGKPHSGKSRLHLYMQDVNTGENVLSQELNIDFSLKGIKTKEDGLAALLTHIADQSLHNFLLSLRPMEVLSAAQNMLLINHGEMAGLSVGDELLIYNKGTKVVDPYTGVTMTGVGSTQVGTARIRGFSVSGWAEADLLTGTEILPGYPIKLATPNAQATEQEKPKIMKPAW